MPLAMRLRLLLVLTFCVLLTLPANAAEDWPALIQNSPKGANSLALLDVESLRNYVNRLKRSRLKPTDLKQLDHLLAELPASVERAAVVAWLDHDTFEPVWEFTTVSFEQGKAPTVRHLVDKEQGYQDVIMGQSVVWSPRGRYLMPYGHDKMAVLKPADRPALARWLRKSKTTRDEMSSFLQSTAKRAGERSALVLAVDMADVISPVQAGERAASLNSVSAAGLSATATGTLLSDLRGISLEVQARDRLQGRLAVEFNVSPTLLKMAGKDVLLEILGRRGMMLPELKSWGFTVEGDNLVLTGPLETASLIDLLTFLTSTPISVVNSPSRQPPAAGTGNTAPPAYSSNPSPEATASKRYFDGVGRVVEECRGRTGISVAEHGYWNDKLSRKIDQLPILNVDPMLLDYGAKSAQLLRGSGMTIRSANMQAATEKVPSYTGYVNYGNGYWGSASFAVNDNRHYNRMVDQGARTQGMTSHYSNLQTIDNMTAEVRRAMTTKYKLEF